MGLPNRDVHRNDRWIPRAIPSAVITECLDFSSLEERPGAFIAQDALRTLRVGFMLDSRLLEVLLQIAVLRPEALRVSIPAK